MSQKDASVAAYAHTGMKLKLLANLLNLELLDNYS